MKLEWLREMRNACALITFYMSLLTFNNYLSLFFSERDTRLTRRAAVGMGIPMGIPMGMGMGWVWER